MPKDQKGDATASGSNGPFLPSQSIPQSDEPSGSQQSQQSMPLSEFLCEMQERILDVERWIRDMVDSGMEFSVEPAERARVGSDFRFEGGFVSGEFQLNWNEILSPEQREGASYSFGIGDDSWRRVLNSGTGRTELMILRGNQNGDSLSRHIDASNVYAPDDNERSTQRE